MLQIIDINKQVFSLLIQKVVFKDKGVDRRFILTVLIITLDNWFILIILGTVKSYLVYTTLTYAASQQGMEQPPLFLLVILKSWKTTLLDFNLLEILCYDPKQTCSMLYIQFLFASAARRIVWAKKLDILLRRQYQNAFFAFLTSSSISFLPAILRHSWWTFSRIILFYNFSYIWHTFLRLTFMLTWVFAKSQTVATTISLPIFKTFHKMASNRLKLPVFSPRSQK